LNRGAAGIDDDALGRYGAVGECTGLIVPLRPSGKLRPTKANKSVSSTRMGSFAEAFEMLSSAFARIPSSEIHSQIEPWMERIGRSLNIDRSVIAEFLPDKSDFQSLYQWTREGFPRGPMALASEVIPWTAAQVRAGKVVVSCSASSLPPEAHRDRAFMLSPAGSKAAVTVPLVLDGELVGGQTFASLRGERKWPPTLVRKLRIVADIFANAIARQQSAARLNRLRHEADKMERLALAGEMAASMAHELNHALGAILANAQAAQQILASQRTSSLEMREIVDDIITADRRASGYLDKVRSLFGKGRLVSASLELGELFSDVSLLMREDLAASGISLQTELAPGLPKINVDRVGVEQVMINLLRNASEAMEGDAARNITVAASRNGERWVRIAVSDTGKGIDESSFDRIFEPLFTTKTTGMGMGLSIVRSIVRSHGGDIRAVHNIDKRGTTFEFTLPALFSNDPTN